MFVAERKTGVEALHVVNRINGHAAFADLAEDTVRVAVQAVERRPVEGGAEADGFLLAREVVETPVGVSGQSQPGKQARRLFNLGSRISDLGSLKIHLGIGGAYERKLAGQSFTVEITRDFSGFIRLRQGQPRKFQTGGRGHRADTGADGVPALEDLIAELRLAPRARDLPLDEAVMGFDCIADLSQYAHGLSH